MRKLTLMPFYYLFLMIFMLLAVEADAQNKGLLWQISGKNIRQPTYLYGTIHLFDTSLYKIPQPVTAKLAQVKKVYFELDLGKMNPAELMIPYNN
jgi:uncharacterized protein